ncbi:hypothetical protein FLLO111716_10130 [Flavobacterium longum]|uniref:hypothetical protein n=1 Tax=Flavobacterium longum TaxID=1299340 RepID=UPI0039EBBD4A
MMDFQPAPKPEVKPLAIVGLVLAGLPLLIYPFVLLANIMSLAGHRSPDTSLWMTFISSLFLILSTLYPVPYLIGLIGYWRTRRNIYAALPCLYGVLVLAIMALWMCSE